MAIDIAQGALISGSLILLKSVIVLPYPTSDMHVLFRYVRCGIVVGHSPRDGQEAKQERPAHRAPTCIGFHMGEDICCIVFVVSLDKKSNAAGEENGEMENDIGLGHLLHPVG